MKRLSFLALSLSLCLTAFADLVYQSTGVSLGFTPLTSEQIVSLGLGSGTEQLCALTELISCENDVLEIPSEVEGHKVVMADVVSDPDDWFTASGKLKFSKVVFPETMVIISVFAVYPDTPFRELYIPKNVREIKAGAFATCSRLVTSIVIDPQNTFYDSRDNSNAIMETATNTLVAGCATTTIPSSTEHLGNYAFSHAPIYRLQVPEGVKTIGDYCFYNSETLESVILPSTLEMIGNYAFYQTKNLKDIGCYSAEPCIVNNLRAFEENVKKEATLYVPKNSWYDGYRIDSFWGDFEKIVEMNEVEDTERVCIDGIYYVLNSEEGTAQVTCRSIIKQEWSSDIYWSDYAGPMSIPSTIDYEGKTYKVTSIDKMTFNGHTLTSLTIPSSVKAIYATTFSQVYINELHLKSIEWWLGLDIVPIENVELRYFSSPLYSKKVFFGDVEADFDNLQIPSGITSIGDCSFANSPVKQVSIPETVTEIGRNAFSECPLTSVVIPDNVVRMGESAFAYCGNLTSAKVGDGIKVIPAVAFAACRKLESVTMSDDIEEIGDNAFANCSSLTSFTIGDKVKRIGDWAFNNSGLTSVTIGKGVKSIGIGAFQNENLKEVVSLIEDPFDLSLYVFSNTTTSRGKLHVPAGTEELYFKCGGWREFQSLIDQMEIVSARSAVASPVRVSVTEGGVRIAGADQGSRCRVFTAGGSMVTEHTMDSMPTVIDLPQGTVYIIEVGGKRVKVVLP